MSVSKGDSNETGDEKAVKTKKKVKHDASLDIEIGLLQIGYLLLVLKTKQNNFLSFIKCIIPS